MILSHKLHHILSIFVCLIVLFIINQGNVQAQVYKTEHGYAQFYSQSTLENFTGKSNYLVGQVNLSDSTVSFYLDLSTLSTGVKLRDEHMQEEFLQTDKYPFAQFYGKITSPFNPASTDTQQVTVKGKFKIHGVTRQITVSGILKKSPHQLFIRAAWNLQLPNYNIDIPKILFMKVNKVQAISIKATLDKKKKS
jgi:polyisoprenoid-binding protein YceI